MTQTTDTDQALTEIAQRLLRIPTLETRKMDRLDFHEVSVWQLPRALEAAYNLGRHGVPELTDDLPEENG